MKKLLTVLLLSSVTVLLGGCFGGDEAQEDVVIDDAYTSDTFVGVIEEIPSTVSGIDATHMMKDELGNTIYLRSLLFDMSKFVGSRLRVSGTLSLEGSADVLLVESRDILEADVVTDSVETLEFKEQGFEIEVDTDKYNVSDTSSFVNFVSSDMTFSVETIKKGFELDLETYLGQNYPNQVPQDVTTYTGDRYSKIVIGTGSYVYLRNTSDIIYELVFHSNLASQAEVNVEIDNLLKSIIFTPETVDTDSTFEIDDSIDNGEETNNDDSTEAQPEEQEIVKTGDLSDLSSEVATVVEDFSRVKSDKIGSDVEIISFAITDNSYAYVSYKNDDAEFRKLFKINSGVFEEVAYFEEGSETDWELVSGQNVAFDRPQKMVFVEDDKYRQVDVKEGYRYFESRPMLFGFHYPRNWYFAGEGNVYKFSTKPISEGETTVLVELIDEDFSDVNYDTKISNSIVKSTAGGQIVYYVKKENNDVIKISGSTDYTEQIDTMAQTFIEVDKK